MCGLGRAGIMGSPKAHHLPLRFWCYLLLGFGFALFSSTDLISQILRLPFTSLIDKSTDINPSCQACHAVKIHSASTQLLWEVKFWIYESVGLWFQRGLFLESSIPLCSYCLSDGEEICLISGEFPAEESFLLLTMLLANRIDSHMRLIWQRFQLTWHFRHECFAFL